MSNSASQKIVRPKKQKQPTTYFRFVGDPNNIDPSKLEQIQQRQVNAAMKSRQEKKEKEKQAQAQQIERFADSNRNVYMKEFPYKSRTTALLFDPFLIKRGKDSFGSELKDRTGRWAFDRAKIGYRAKQQSDIVFQNVGNYILQFKDQGKRLDLFKNALQQRITDAKINVSQYNIEQIAQFFPWIMSCQLLFQPLRSYMFCLANGISSTYANEVESTLPSSMINYEVNKAMYHAVLTNGSLIEDAKSIYSQRDIGVMIKGFRMMLTGTKAVKQFFKNTIQSLSQGAKKAAQYIKDTKVGGAVNNVYNRMLGYFTMNKIRNKMVQEKPTETQAAEVAGAIKFFDELITQIFKQLRVYGQIIVNVNYIRVTAQRRIMDGRLMFYYVDRPNLLFSINNSFLTVYEKKNDIITQIPQADFTVSYLRKLVQNQVVNLGGRMFRNIKDEITMTQQDKQGMKRFAQKFLRWDERVPKPEAEDLKQYQQEPTKKSIKVEKVKGKRLDRLMDAYMTDVEGGQIFTRPARRAPQRKIEFQQQDYGNVGSWQAVDGELNPKFEFPDGRDFFEDEN